MKNTATVQTTLVFTFPTEMSEQEILNLFDPENILKAALSLQTQDGSVIKPQHCFLEDSKLLDYEEC